MKNLVVAISLMCAVICSELACAQTQEVSIILNVANEYLKQQTNEFGSKVEITMGNVDSRLHLQPCQELAAFLPPGSRASGKLTVGVRCAAPKPWTIYISANVKITGYYYISANQLSVGQIMSMQDLLKVEGELNNLPANAITKTQQAIGKVVQGNYPAGICLRTDMLKTSFTIQQGQSVKIISNGHGFSVSNEAIAINNASEGQVAKARTINGQLVAGIAKLGGIIEIQN